MDLNKAMVELYKQRNNSASKQNKTLATKRAQIDSNEANGTSTDPLVKENPNSSKRSRLEDAFEVLDYKPRAHFEDLHGLESVKTQILNIVQRFLRSTKGSAKKSEWPVLIYGSHGLGKTSIVEAAANYANLKMIPITLRVLVEQTRNEFRVTVKQIVTYCLANQPSIVLFDDLEQLNDKEDLRYIVRSAIKRLLSEENSLLIFCTASSILDNISGIDFLFTIHLKRPDMEARYKILNSLRKNNANTRKLTNTCLRSLAINTPSFTALDLRKMLDIAETESTGEPEIMECDRAVDIIKQSFRRSTHLIGEKPTVTWADIGGLSEVRQEFIEILRQIRKGAINCKFAGIALYGPPGCGKTMVAQAMANEAGFNFISIKPAELVDKFLGETEKNIRRVFSESQEYEPCMIYFDEFDGLCGTRGNKDTVTSAIQTLLSEMDGFAGRGKSMILASTNRLEDIDPAMKRPGRLSKHIYVGPPNEIARREILAAITNKPPLSLAGDVDLSIWAKKTEFFTGADLHFLVAEAESRAISDGQDELNLDTEKVVLSHKHFEYAVNKLRTTNMELDKKIKFAER